MSERRIEEETADGWKQMVWATVAYQDGNGQFVSRDDYLENREEVGYGEAGYGGWIHQEALR